MMLLEEIPYAMPHLVVQTRRWWAIYARRALQGKPALATMILLEQIPHAMPQLVA